MNKFSSEQEDTIKDLAWCFWEHNQRAWYPEDMPQETLDKLRVDYIRVIIAGLEDPAIWG